jgi:ABC-type branched-subunit amino acid transport system substrate-binding protein
MFIEDITGTASPGIGQAAGSALKADAAAFNTRGGINGHPIDLIVCDSASNTNGDAACGQQAVSDGAIAVIAAGNESVNLQYLAPAKIASLNNGYQPDEWKNPDSFMISAAGLAGITGPPAVVKFAGCKDYAFVEAGFPSAFQQATIAGEKVAAGTFGVTAVANLFPPASTVDMTSYILQAAHSGAQCIIIAGSAAQEVAALEAVSTLPSSEKVLAYGSNLVLPGEAASLAPVTTKLGNRLIVIGDSAPPTSTNPQVKQWVKDQGGKDLEGTTEVAWADLALIVKAGAAIGSDVTAASIQNYLNNLSNYDPGISGPVSFNQPVSNPFGPRIFAAYVLPQSYSNGQLPAAGPFINLLTGATSPSS